MRPQGSGWMEMGVRRGSSDGRGRGQTLGQFLPHVRRAVKAVRVHGTDAWSPPEGQRTRNIHKRNEPESSASLRWPRAAVALADRSANPRNESLWASSRRRRGWRGCGQQEGPPPQGAGCSLWGKSSEQGTGGHPRASLRLMAGGSTHVPHHRATAVLGAFLVLVPTVTLLPSVSLSPPGNSHAQQIPAGDQLGRQSWTLGAHH